MLDFKVSQKTETKTQINKKFKKKGWVKKTLLGLAVFSVITASSATFLYKTEISPEVAKITKTIDKNKQYLSHVDKSLFSKPYTDDDFKEDLAILDKLDARIFRKAVDNGKYKRGLFESFNDFVYYRSLNSTINYNEMYNDLLINKGYNSNDTDKIRDAKYKKVKAMEEKIAPSARKMLVIPTLINVGFFGPTDEAYDNIVDAFHKEYGENAYTQIFIVYGGMILSDDKKPRHDYQELRKARYNALYEMEQAYRNKDYEKLRVYFKQSREFYRYIAGMDLGNSKYSSYLNDSIEGNNFSDAIKFSLIYNTVKDKSNSVDEAVINTQLY